MEKLSRARWPYGIQIHIRNNTRPNLNIYRFEGCFTEDTCSNYKNCKLCYMINYPASRFEKTGMPSDEICWNMNRFFFYEIKTNPSYIGVADLTE